jgi:limonene-1,2-epoxide hydrolase
MTESLPTEIVDRFMQALAARDFGGARRLLADDLRFDGPLDRFERADDYMQAIAGLYGMVRAVEHQTTVAQGDEVVVFYTLDTPVAKAPVAEWYTVRGDKIGQLRAYFDARPFARPAPTAS